MPPTALERLKARQQRRPVATVRIRLEIVIWSHAASCCARVSTRSDFSNSLSCGNGRCASTLVRRMLASTIASHASDLPREDR